MGAGACACACAVVCVRYRACLCMRARQPTACMIWRMQTRAYVGAELGACDGNQLGTCVGASLGVPDVGLHAQTACSMLPLHVRPTIPLVAAQISLSPGADVD